MIAYFTTPFEPESSSTALICKIFVPSERSSVIVILRCSCRPTKIGALSLTSATSTLTCILSSTLPSDKMAFKAYEAITSRSSLRLVVKIPVLLSNANSGLKAEDISRNCRGLSGEISENSIRPTSVPAGEFSATVKLLTCGTH